MSLKTWGIHLFKAPPFRGLYSASYYLERRYAPLLIFSPPEKSLEKPRDFEFIESKGGLTFQLHLYPDRPNSLQRDLYQRFGCPLVAPWTDEVLEEFVHEDYSFRYGRRDHDFFDHHVLWTSFNDRPALYLMKDEAHFLFLGAPWLLDRGVIRHGPTGLALQDFDLQYRQKGKTKRSLFALFQFYRGLNWCDISSMLS